MFYTCPALSIHMVVHTIIGCCSISLLTQHDLLEIAPQPCHPRPMDTQASGTPESLTQTYIHAREDGNLELALQIAFRLEDEKRGKTREAATWDHAAGR